MAIEQIASAPAPLCTITAILIAGASARMPSERVSGFHPMAIAAIIPVKRICAAAGESGCQILASSPAAATLNKRLIVKSKVIQRQSAAGIARTSAA